MASPHQGSLYFDFAVNDFAVFESRLANTFIRDKIGATDVQKKKAYLLTALSEATHKLLRSLCVPQTIEECDFDSLLDTLKTHFAPPTSYFAARQKFYTAVKRSQETPREWSARLRLLASDCKFGTEIQVVLRDIFVSNYNKGPVQDRMFEEDASLTTVTLKDLIDLADRKEAALLARQDRHANVPSTSGTSVKVEPEDELYYAKKRGPSRKSRFEKQPQVPKYHHKNSSCSHCGRNNHQSENCYYKDLPCHSCKVRGHLASICPNKKKHKYHKTKYLDDVSSDTMSDSTSDEDQEILSDSFFHLFSLDDDTPNEKILKHSTNKDKKIEPFKVPLKINNSTKYFEIDTGSFNNIISNKFYSKNFSSVELENVETKLSDYVGNIIEPLGQIHGQVSYNDKIYKLPFLVVKNGGPPLIGRNGFNILNLSIEKVTNFDQMNFVEQKIDFSNMNCPTDVKNILNKYSEVFSPGLGTYSQGQVKLRIAEGSIPKFFKCRTLPLALKSKVESELDRLLAIGVLKPVDHSPWATPIVPVLKADGNVRICGDFKITINPVLEGTEYPLPRIDHIYASLGNSKYWTKLDLQEAYQQCLIDSESQKYVVINTTKGLFAYQRLCYGISSAPAEFQRIMDKLLKDIGKVQCLLDDVIIAGKTIEEHNFLLEKVLKIFKENGLKLKLKKCSFCMSSIEYLGHKIDSNGLHPSGKHVEAIKNAPPPDNPSLLKSFLGLITFYLKFIPKSGDLLGPMYALLRKNAKWHWSPECQKSFIKIKQILCSEPVVAHYEPDLPLQLWCDASPLAISAVLSHSYPDGSVKPLAFYSKVLTESQARFPQIEREAAAIFYGVNRFKDFLYARKFLLVTDSKPLVYIFGSKKGIPVYAANRLQRWAYQLSSYNFTVKFTKSESNIADFLSRVKIPGKNPEDLFESVNYVQYINENFEFKLDWKTIRAESKKDPFLKKIMTFVHSGLWPQKIARDDPMFQYFIRKNELTIEFGCLMWGYRVVVPHVLQSRILKLLHSTHLGIVKMKGIARCYFWWAGIDHNIEELAGSCDVCIQFRSDPPKSVLSPWPWTSKPWTRIHIDFLGPWKRLYYFVVMDSHSKWIECYPAHSTSTDVVIEKLGDCFSRFGLPRSITSDGGTCFTSAQFTKYLSTLGINHHIGAPYHPQSNGAAESAVKIIKSCLKKADKVSGLSLTQALNNYLFLYRASIHSTTQESPAKLMLGREVRTIFSQLRPSVDDIVLENQMKQKRNYRGNRNVSFAVGDKILARDYRGQHKWVQGTVTAVLGPQLYQIVTTANNLQWKRHVDQLLSDVRVPLNLPKGEVEMNEKEIFQDLITSPDCEFPKTPTHHSGDCVTDPIANVSTQKTPETTPKSSRSGGRPKRLVKPPNRYTP